MDITPFLVPLAMVIGAALTLAGTIFIASKRKPVEVKDYWAENRSLRDEVDDVRQAFDAYREKTDKLLARLRQQNRVLYYAFQATLRWLDYIQLHWTTGTFPRTSDADAKAIDRARTVELDDDLLN